MRLCRILLVVGVVVGLPSLWETLSFSWDPTFQAPSLRYGPTHTSYHAFREFTLTVGAIGIMVWGMFRPGRDRTPALWWTMALAAGFYYGGWWLPWPILGLHTPTLPAELVHEAAASSSCSSIALAWRMFRPAQSTAMANPAAEPSEGGTFGERTSTVVIRFSADQTGERITSPRGA